MEKDFAVVKSKLLPDKYEYKSPLSKEFIAALKDNGVILNPSQKVYLNPSEVSKETREVKRFVSIFDVKGEALKENPERSGYTVTLEYKEKAGESDTRFAEAFRQKMYQLMDKQSRGALLSVQVNTKKMIDNMMDALGAMQNILIERERKTALFQFCKNHKIKTPIQLEIDMKKWVKDPKRQGNDKRYMRISIQDYDVTGMVANAINMPISKARMTHGTMIVHGSGMDMFFAIQHRVANAAKSAGYPKMFDDNRYIDKRYENRR